MMALAMRTCLVAVGFAFFLAACSSGDAVAEGSTTSVQATVGAAESATSTVGTPSASATATVPEPIPVGEWAETVFDEDQFIVDFVPTADGRLLGLLCERTGRFRVIELGADGDWAELTDWVAPSTVGFNYVGWSSLTVFDGYYVVAGSGQLPTDGPHVTHVPAFARIDIATGATTVELEKDNPNNWIVSDVTVFGDKLVAVGEAPNGSNDWGPGIWVSNDGLMWERSETPHEVAGVIIQLGTVVEWGGLAVSVGQNNWDTDPPYVLWSTDGVDWEADVLPGVAADERVRLSGVVHDGSEFVIVGTSVQVGEAIWRSSDGLSWVRDETQPAVFGDGEVNTDGVWGSNGTVLVSGDGRHRQAIQYCVDDPSTCRQSFTALWLRSGSTWQRLIPPSDRWTYTVAVINQRIVTTGRVEDAGAVWVWTPAADDLLPIGPPFDTSPPVSDLPELRRDPVIEKGAEYVVPLSEACHGMSYLGYVNGVHWLLEGERMQFSDEWPVLVDDYGDGPFRTVFGTIELVSPEQIEYTVDGFGVVAVYVPAPEDYEPYGCM